MARHLETQAVIIALEALGEIQRLCGGAGERVEAEPVRQAEPVETLLSLLRGEWILSVQGYFVNHRPSFPYARLDDEYKVQDLVYCVASTVIPDLHYENPQRKTRGALTSTRVDFSSQSARMLLEVKLATGKHQAKAVESEISEDIVKYGKQASLDTLVFFVFCHDYVSPNAREFEAGFTGTHQIGQHAFRTICVVKP
jgi:hypothetical protein